MLETKGWLQKRFGEETIIGDTRLDRDRREDRTEIIRQSFYLHQGRKVLQMDSAFTMDLKGRDEKELIKDSVGLIDP